MKLYRDFETQEAIDEQYNVELSVPDFMIYANQFIDESAQARDKLPCHIGVRFGPTLDETLDIFPAADRNAPILMFIHGGYWRILTSSEFDFVATGPVQRGITVVVTNYSLCPKVTISEITRQSRAALAWLYNTELDFNGDRERIYVAGHSAGGQQTAMLLGTDWAGEYGLPADVVRGGIAISGLFDLRPLRYSFVQPKLLLNHDVIERESPLFHIPESAPRLLVSVGDEEPDEFRRQSHDYYAAWTAAGLGGEHWEQAGKNHFTAIEGFLDPASELCERVNTFIKG